MSRATIRVYDDGCGRLRLRWFCDDSALWHQILADFKDTFRTHGERSFNSSTRAWSVPLWCRHRLQEWADYWFDPSDQQWGDDEDGYAHGRTYSDRSYGQYSRPQTSTSTVEAAYAHLCLTPDAPPELVRVVHHFWVKEVHPDSGHGDGARMAGINAAVDMIRTHVERKAS